MEKTATITTVSATVTAHDALANANRMFRRARNRILDMKALYGFWQDGFPVEFNAHGWNVNFRKQGGK